MGLMITNEAGEFCFEFENERSVSLEIEISPNDWVLFLSPPLDWVGRAGDQPGTRPGATDISIMDEGKPPRRRGRLA
jgi:hypothetical protein